MWDFVSKIFSSDFMPHGHCYLWTPSVMWLHVISDSVITLSYYSIPLALVYIVRHRKNLSFNWMVLMFASFIFACGTTHIMDVWTVWHGTYRLQGVVKLFTAIISACTAVLLWRLIPQAMRIPTSEQLQQEIEQRESAQRLLEETNDALEQRVLERTDELQQSNDQLREKSEKLQRYYDVTIDRELQMIKLKEEINELLSEMGRQPRYRVVKSGGKESTPRLV